VVAWVAFRRDLFTVEFQFAGGFRPSADDSSVRSYSNNLPSAQNSKFYSVMLDN
jgi:hypothetical protein